MGKESEIERHNRMLEEIKNAKTKEEIPSVTISNITKYLASNVNFNKKRLQPATFKPVVDATIEYGFFLRTEVKDVFFNILKEHYPEVDEAKFLEKYKEVAITVNNYIQEMGERAGKLKEFEDKEDLDEHNSILKQIRNANEISELPKVGRGTLNQRVQRDAVNDFVEKLPMSELEELTEAIYQEKSDKEIEDIVEKICIAQNLGEEHTQLMKEQIISGIITDKKIGYIVEELKKKEERTAKIYELDHEETMENIKEARRISQLPPNLTSSTLTSYLAGNTIIYPKGDRISTTDMQEVTKLLLEEKDINSDEVKYELKKLANEYYAENPIEAYELLYRKLSALPKINYYVEEINYSKERQEEFIGRGNSNVNVYFIPNPKSPETGGIFYNCYINRVDNLDLHEILPLDLNEIVPPEMDVDSIEWYVQQNYDETFKTAGGIILNRDETIGNVNIFRPSDGKFSISPEEKSRNDKLKELTKMVREEIKAKNEENEKFKKDYNDFIASQKERDEKLNDLLAQIDEMTQENEEER